MAEVESRFEGGEGAITPADSGQLLALVDALHADTPTTLSGKRCRPCELES
jgi:hypothetical protein